MRRTFVFSVIVLGSLVALSARAAALDELARDVDRTANLRAVKHLQHTWSQYAQFGLWNEVGDLFSKDGRFVFDGLVGPERAARGPKEIAAFLRTRYGGGKEGLRANGLSAMMVESPVVNLSVDGDRATARWQAMIFHGHDGAARIEGGVFVNEYARERGVWKIALAHYHPQYDGPYEQGWTNWGGGDLPVVPYHFDTRSAGVPIPAAMGAAPRSRATLAELQRRIDALNDEDRVRNLQAAYGFYADRKMWDDVLDLFADDGVVEVGGQGVWRGKAGIARWLASIGPAGLSHGQLNDRVQNDVTVTISPGGNEAYARGIELGMLGEADEENGWWEVATFHTRFVKERGAWKIRELRRFPQMKADVLEGWGRSRIVDAAPVGTLAPDARNAEAVAANLAMPEFLSTHPVTGKRVRAAGDARLVVTRPLTGAIARPESRPVALEEVTRRLARSTAVDGIANVSAAYGFFVDDSNAAGWAGVMAKNGFKETPFSGYHIGRDRLIAARVRGKPPERQAGISYHWLMQPVVRVSEDGRSAAGRFRLFQPRTGKSVGKAGDFFAASFWGGMYHDRYVLEDGVWRIWELTLEEPYITPVAWKDGVWAKAKDPGARGPSIRGGSSANVDIPLAALGRREEHFPGGTGEPLQWPSILPMWFDYTNPVSGRVPERFQDNCAPCAVRPDLRLDRNGWQEPPDAPAANRSP